MKIEYHVNRHPNCDGTSWGWFTNKENGQTIGYWSNRTVKPCIGIDEDTVKAMELELAQRRR